MWPVMVSTLLATSHFMVALNMEASSWSRPKTRLALTMMPRSWISPISRLYSSTLFCRLPTSARAFSLMLSKPTNRLLQPVSAMRSRSGRWFTRFTLTARVPLEGQVAQSAARCRNSQVQAGLPMRLSSMNITCRVSRVLISRMTSSTGRLTIL